MYVSISSQTVGGALYTYGTVVDQTNVTTKTTFYNGKRLTEALISNPSAAEGSWANGPTTTYNIDGATLNLLSVRSPDDQGQGSSFWTVANEYNGGANAPGAVTKTTLKVWTGGTTTDRVTEYAYAHGHYRLTQSKTLSETSPAVVYHVTDYFYDGDTTNTGASGWVNLTKAEQYDYDQTNATNTTKHSVQYTVNTSTRPGRVTSKTDPNGNAWSYTYDDRGNRTQTTSPGGTGRTTQTSYETTAYLMPLTATDNAGNVFSYTYYRDDSPTHVPDWTLERVSVNTTGTPASGYAFDANGRLTWAGNLISGNNGSGGDIVQTPYTITDKLRFEEPCQEEKSSIFSGFSPPKREVSSVSEFGNPPKGPSSLSERLKKAPKR
jgi:YD repeat-containing protein